MVRKLSNDAALEGGILFFCVNKKYQKCIHKHITLFHKKTPRNLIRALYGGYILYFHQMAYRER
ncbi:hypothetical protein AE937_19700 [Bacteroides fragilis]|nr:hypothetical protein [Bacteroides fragilis]